jgi:putative hydrolase of the HAD superfamily
MDLKGVLFDLDDTLYDQLQPFSKAFQNLFLYQIKEFQLNIESIYKRSRYYSDVLWKEYTEVRLSLTELRINRLVYTFRDFGCQLTAKEAVQLQKRYELNQGKIKLFNDVIPLFSLLKKHDFLLGIITNRPVEHQSSKLNQLKVYRYIYQEDVFYFRWTRSSETGSVYI